MLEDEVLQSFKAVRRRLEQVFPHVNPHPSSNGLSASSGHCAAASLVAAIEVGGTLAKATVNGVSHWFNRIRVKDRVIDVDITSDQFGRDGVTYAEAGELYEGSIQRSFADLNVETLDRAVSLAKKSHLHCAVREIERIKTSSQLRHALSG